VYALAIVTIERGCIHARWTSGRARCLAVPVNSGGTWSDVAVRCCGGSWALTHRARRPPAGALVAWLAVWTSAGWRWHEERAEGTHAPPRGRTRVEQIAADPSEFCDQKSRPAHRALHGHFRSHRRAPEALF